MLALPGKARVFLHNEPTDMRKSFEALGILVEQVFQEEISSGAYFVFLNRHKDRMKVLYWDGDGLVIWYKRLEKGSFACKKKGSAIITRREFLMLLEGVIPQKIHKRYILQ